MGYSDNFAISPDGRWLVSDGIVFAMPDGRAVSLLCAPGKNSEWKRKPYVQGDALVDPASGRRTHEATLANMRQLHFSPDGRSLDGWHDLLLLRFPVDGNGVGPGVAVTKFALPDVQTIRSSINTVMKVTEHGQSREVRIEHGVVIGDDGGFDRVNWIVTSELNRLEQDCLVQKYPSGAWIWTRENARVWRTGKAGWSPLDLDYRPFHMASDPSGQRMAVWHNGGINAVSIYTIEGTLIRRWVMEGHNAAVWSRLAWLPGDRVLVSGATNRFGNDPVWWQLDLGASDALSRPCSVARRRPRLDRRRALAAAGSIRSQPHRTPRNCLKDSTMTYVFHMIPNAHLDPVWLWDWREGFEEGISTCRSVLDLMDEDDEVTFSRGEAAIYAYIAEHDPATFKRILKRIREGRWEVVGGTWVQADTNLPAIETFARLYAVGQAELLRLTGKRARVAWAADSFGHAAGLPEVMAHAGIDGFAFTRPDAGRLPFSKPAFWWESESGARVLSYRPATGWYGAERHELPGRLDALLAEAAKHGMRNVGVFFGLGNHGGGPTRRHLADLRAWAAKHPEVELAWDGLHGLIDAIRAEAAKQPKDWLPVHRGELGHCLRGCYASNLRFKSAFRHAECDLVRGEAADAALGTLLKRQPAPLGEAWQGMLFNTFHDILPGSSIERAYDQQLDWLGGVRHRAAEVQQAALGALARRIDTTVPAVGEDHPRAQPVLVWNPLPRASGRLVELEASLDWRPIWKYRDHEADLPLRLRGPDGTDLPFQCIETEHRSMPGLPWRFRVLAPLAIPGLGWSVADLGWVEGATAPVWKGPAATADGEHAIACGAWRVAAKPGDAGVTITRDGKPFLGGDGLQARLDDDRYGSWGGMGEEPESFTAPAEPRERWRVAQVVMRERGPLRAALWVRLAGARSRLDLEFRLESGRDAVDIQARVCLDERSARLRLVLPTGSDEATYATPGATLTRGPIGEVPGGRWVRSGGVGFASDALYSYHTIRGELAASISRATRFADDRVAGPEFEPWRPVQDTGEHRFACLLAPGDADLGALAEELAQPVQTVPVAARPGKLARRGGLLEVSPASVRVLAVRPVRGGVILRLHNEGAAVAPKVRWQGKALALGKLPAGSIRSWKLGAGKAKAADLLVG